MQPTIGSIMMRTTTTRRKAKPNLFHLVFILVFLYIVSLMDCGKSQPIRIATYNCRSLKSSLMDVRSLCSTHDIVFLQETWLLPHDLSILNCIDDDFLSFGNSAVDTNDGFLVGRPFGGLAILWKKGLGEYISINDYGDSRLLGITIAGSDFSCIILNVYMPTAGNDNHDDYQDYLGKIQSILQGAGYGHIIVLGDWNANAGRIEFEWMSNLSNDLDLHLTDTCLLPCDTFTYVSDVHHTTSWIDHVLMSSSVNGVCVDMTVLYDHVISDHRPISFGIDLGNLPRLEDCRPSPTAFKISWDKLSQDDITGYAVRVDASLRNIALPVDALLCAGCVHDEHRYELSQFYELVNKAMLDASKCFRGQVTHSGNAIAGWSELVAESHSEARENFLSWVWMGKP